MTFDPGPQPSAAPQAYRFYLSGQDAPGVAGGWPAGLRLEFWRPTWRRPFRRDLASPRFWAWSLFHLLGVFATRDYVLALVFQGDRLVHRTCVFPRHFRFPFMAPEDLQAAGIWTDPALRGQGLALRVLAEVLRRTRGRRVWYLVREANQPSIALARKAGMRLVGRGGRHRRLGLWALGYFQIDQAIG